MRVQEYFENLTSPTSFSLKRATTTSTKESHSSNDSAYSSYFNFPNYYRNNTASDDSSYSYDESNNSSLTSRYSFSTRDRTLESEDTSILTGRSEEETVPSLEYSGANDDEEETVPSLESSVENDTEEETVPSMSYLDDNGAEEETVASLECEIVNYSDDNRNSVLIDPILEAVSEDESFVDDENSEANTVNALDDYDDHVTETKTTNGSVSLGWDHGRAVASSFRTVTNNHSAVEDVCELPEGICKSDITVTIDIDDEARSSRVGELDEEDLDVEILKKSHRKLDSGDFSPRKQNQRARVKFEETVQQGILDDLQSFYTATPKNAKLVLCVVVSVLSDGTLDHTFWSGGRVGLTEIVLQWVMFDADDLQVYKRGRVVRKKDFGFGPLGLTENEGQHYLSTKLAPRASNDVISQIGNGDRSDLLSEF